MLLNLTLTFPVAKPLNFPVMAACLAARQQESAVSYSWPAGGENCSAESA